MNYSFTTYLWFFIVYAFLGWVVEVAFHGVTSGKFINRGFLNGPVCPIYGFGMIILLYFLSPLTNNLILLFIGSVILTSTLEFVTGFVLEKVFDEKWWDYTNMPFNIKGYISLAFSILWGLAAIFVMDIVHPPISKFISIFNNTLGDILLILFMLYFLADFIVTLVGILEINRRFRILEGMASKLKLYSDDIGEDIYKKVSTVVEVTNMINEEKPSKFMEKKHFVHRRLEKSYPNIKKRLSKFEKEDKIE